MTAKNESVKGYMSFREAVFSETQDLKRAGAVRDPGSL
jgi:hypothetical protein